MGNKRYIIVCDESTRYGKDYSYFYGGAIIEESKYQHINEVLKSYQLSKNMGEIKRTKITCSNYRDYIEILELFFTYVKSGAIKARVMFSPNKQLEILPKKENQTYCKFYYLFIRYAFSITYAREPITLRLIFDDLPEKKAYADAFKNYLVTNLNSAKVVGGNPVNLIKKDIEEVDSKKHVILQCMDVIVGLVDFALNTSYEDRISKRGQARTMVWKQLERYIYEIHPNFNMRETTNPIFSHRGWIDEYKHFAYKKGKNKAPAVPT